MNGQVVPNLKKPLMVKGNAQNSRRISWYSKITLLGLLLLLSMLSGEFAARAFWYIKYQISFRDPGPILYAYYPDLAKIDQKAPTHDDDFFDILLLGGSVLNKNWGTVEKELREQLALTGHYKVRIFNLAQPSHTSRDSWLKYSSLENSRFELVILYHGINESRVNNAPPEIFQADYSHFWWYETVNALAPYHKTNSLSLPYTFQYLSIRGRQVLHTDRYVPKWSPKPEWVHYGETIRSATSYEHNVRAILDLATQRGDRMLLMSFAIYVPKNYSAKAFADKELDYARHQFPIEVWGKKDNVIAAVETHNEVLRKLAPQYRNVVFLDQANLIKGSARSFNDICHFTTFGSSKFVENLIGVVLPIFPRVVTH